MNSIKRRRLMMGTPDKGFIRKATQSFPITLKDCVDNDSLINMSIEGNCYQDGEPSYDNPIEIQSVGERTVNILVYPYLEKSKTTKGITYTVNDDGSIAISGTSDSDYAAFTLTKDLQLTVGKTYILKNDCSVASLYFKYTDEAGKAVFRGLRNGCISTIWQEGYTFESVYAQVNPAGTVVDETMHPMLIEADCTSDDNLIPYPYRDTSKEYLGITYTDNGDGTITLDGTYTDSSTMVDFQLLGTSSAPIEFPSGTYIITGCPLNGSTTSYRIIGMTKSAEGTLRYFTDIGNGCVFEVPEGGSLWLAIRTGVDLGTVSGLTFRPCITKVDGYQPYGYKILIVAETENLFVVDKLYHTTFKDAYIAGEGIKGFAQAVDSNKRVTENYFKAGHTYTMSFDMEMLEKGSVGTFQQSTYGLGIYDVTKSQFYLRALKTTGFNVGEKEHMSVTATFPDSLDGANLAFYYYTGRYVAEDGTTSDNDTIRFTDIKIEDADHETEPIVSNMYAKEPLRAVNQTYKDVLDVKKGECTRNIKTAQLDKNSDFTFGVLAANNVPVIRYKLSEGYNFGNVSENLICSHYPISAGNTYYGRSTAVYQSALNLFIYHEGITTLAEYIELLGDDVIDVAYVLAEPTTEKIIAPNLPTFKHGTTYSIATAVQPLSGTVEYYSTTKGE